MRLLLFGSFGSGNLGDEATLQSLVRGWRAAVPHVALTVASLAPERHAGLPVTTIHAHDASALGAAIAAADLVVVAGGRLWRGQHGLDPGDLFRPAPSDLAHAARPLLTAAALGTRAVLFASGIGPLAGPEARRAMAALASLAAHVSVRDDESAELLRAAGFGGGLLIVPDPAIAIVPDPPATIPARRHPRRLAVVPQSRLDGPTETSSAALAAALREIGGALEVILLAFDGDTETAELERLRAAMALAPDAVQIVVPPTPEAAAAWLGSCDVALTAQPAAVILAAVAGTPAVAVGDDPALLGHARLLGLADLVLPARSASPAAIAQTVERALAARPAAATGLAARVDVARTLLAAGQAAVVTAAAAPPASTSDAAARAELAAYERACSRLRTQLEQREESWRTLAGLVGHDFETVEPVSTSAAQRSRDIRTLRARAEAAEAELETIKRSLGWRLLHRYGRLKHHYLLPALRMLRRRRPAAPAQPTEDADPVTDGVVPGAFDVVCFPIIDWDFRFQRPQHLMSRFAAAGHRVFYLAPEFATSGEPFTVEPKAPNVWRVTLRGPRRNVWTEALDAADTDRIFASLNRMRAQLSLGATLACVELPFWWPLAALARERFAWPILYDCMDHHAGFSTHTGATGDHERQLFAGADQVVVSSAQLEQVARPLARQLRLVRNGCEYEHFATAAGTPRGARPVIGFYGAIADWFDADLVADLAERRPDWDFLLVGSTDLCDVSRLAALPNVMLPGEQPYAEIPAWLAKMDVTLLPFKRLPLTEATNPVKAYEILASGKTLVSVPLPEMRPLAPLVRLAATAEEFEREIAAALAAKDDPTLVARRQAFAKANTWDVRFAELAATVPALFSKASIVIVTYNNLDMTERCLDSVFACTDWPNVEVLIVDNASSDGTPDFLRALAERRTDVTVICNADNRGFAAGCNQGLAIATGEYLVLLNNDTVVSRRWLSALIRHLVAVPEIGLIGPVTNEIGNESKVAVRYQSVEGMPAWAARYTRDHDDRLRSMQMLAMFCVAMRRQAFVEVGPLDERFAVGMFEDDDYSRRIRARGYTIVSARDAFVHHAGGASFKRLDRAHYRRVFERNRRLYERKWGLWTPHQDEATVPRIDAYRAELAEIVAAAGVQPHQVVVFLRAAAPTPLAGRSEHLAAALARLGLLVFLDRTGEDDREGFRQLAHRLWQYGGPLGVLEQLEAPLVWALPHNGLDGFRWVRRTLVYDVADALDSFPFEPPLVRDNHERLLREADIVVCASRALLESVRAARPDAVYVPNGAAEPAELGRQRAALDPAFAAVVARDRPLAAYVGPLETDLDAAWLAAVARARPDWSFAVLGSAGDDAALTAVRQVLDACGNVDVLAPPSRDALGAHLGRVTVGLFPLTGGEVRACPVGVFDCLAAGTPVVTTLAACAELPHVTLAATPDAAAAALAQLGLQSGEAGARDRIRRDTREHGWTARAQETVAVLRRHRRSERRRREAPVLRHADALAGQRSYRGTCNVCGHATFFYFEREALYRETLHCVECLATSRYRSLARGILRALRELVGVDAESLAELADLPTQRVIRVYDTQVPFYWATGAYPLPDLLARCDWIEVHTSTYRAREPLGSALGPRRTNQNLERLTFADDTFDLVLTSDVMEHVRLDARAHAEIRRVLRPGGVYLFTVPHRRDQAETLVRVAITDPDDPLRDRHLLEPEYHGDANSEEDRALAYRTYGTDLDRTLERLGFAVEYAKEDLPELGILNTELFYCRVVRAPARSALAERDWAEPRSQRSPG